MREGIIPDDRNRLYMISRWDVCGAREGIRPYERKDYRNSPICIQYYAFPLVQAMKTPLLRRVKKEYQEYFTHIGGRNFR